MEFYDELVQIPKWQAVTLTRTDPPRWESMYPWTECVPKFLPLLLVLGSCLCGSCSDSTVYHRVSGESTRMDFALAPENTSYQQILDRSIKIHRKISIHMHIIFAEGKCSNLILLEVCSDSPALVIGQCVPVFLEQGVDTRNTSVPGILQILKSQTPVTPQNIFIPSTTKTKQKKCISFTI